MTTFVTDRPRPMWRKSLPLILPVALVLLGTAVWSARNAERLAANTYEIVNKGARFKVVVSMNTQDTSYAYERLMGELRPRYEDALRCLELETGFQPKHPHTPAHQRVLIKMHIRPNGAGKPVAPVTADRTGFPIQQLSDNRDVMNCLLKYFEDVRFQPHDNNNETVRIHLIMDRIN